MQTVAANDEELLNRPHHDAPRGNHKEDRTPVEQDGLSSGMGVELAYEQQEEQHQNAYRDDLNARYQLIKTDRCVPLLVQPKEKQNRQPEKRQRGEYRPERARQVYGLREPSPLKPRRIEKQVGEVQREGVYYEECD